MGKLSLPPTANNTKYTNYLLLKRLTPQIQRRINNKQNNAEQERADRHVCIVPNLSSDCPSAGPSLRPWERATHTCTQAHTRACTPAHRNVHKHAHTRLSARHTLYQQVDKPTRESNICYIILSKNDTLVHSVIIGPEFSLSYHRISAFSIEITADKY